MRMYVIATPEHFELDHKLDVSRERKSVTGEMAVVEIDEAKIQPHRDCGICEVCTHGQVLERLNAKDAAGVWYKKHLTLPSEKNWTGQAPLTIEGEGQYDINSEDNNLQEN